MPSSSIAHITRLVLALHVVLATVVAEAYVGPGAGISFLQGLWVALVGVVLSIVAIILLPFKLLFRNFGKIKAALLLVGLGFLVWLAHEYNSQAVPEKLSGRTIVLGFDGMDHRMTQSLIEAGKLPNLARLAQQGFGGPLETSVPPLMKTMIS